MNHPDPSSLRYQYQPAARPAVATLLLLHGSGGDEEDLLPLAAEFGPEVNILSVRGNVLECGRPRFFRHLGMGFFNEEEVLFRTRELVGFLREISCTEGFDLSQLVAIGYCNGAAMAGSLLLLFPDLLAGAVLWRPLQPLRNPPPAAQPPRRTAVLFSAGLSDCTVPRQATKRYAALLAGAGFQVTRLDAEAGHNLTSSDVHLAVRWFRQRFVLREVYKG
jgi:phospholipase/carboxylesterase